MVTMEKIWKEFGKNSEAGKLLHELYGVRYKPQINYPKLKLKSQEQIENEKRAKSTNKPQKRKTLNIDYPNFNKKPSFKINKIDLIPKRKTEALIKNELETFKKQNIPPKNNNLTKDRKQEIMKLQDKFQFQERKVMPKGARLPGLKDQLDGNNENLLDKIVNEEIKFDKLSLKDFRGDKLGELEFLYHQIIKEIDERYALIEENKKTKMFGNKKSMSSNINVQYNEGVIMNEIKDRLNDLKSLEKMIKEFK